MGIQYHPQQGTILRCDFQGFVAPEMTKRRPAVVVSDPGMNRPGLCAVVPLSTSAPTKIQPYHHKLHVNPVLPRPYDSPFHWVKADMVYTVSFSRLDLLFNGKDPSGKRIYDVRVIDQADLLKIQDCILHGLGMGRLTPYL